MMVWLFPAALIGLLAAAAPVVIHLLRRHQARRVVLPSVRFVVAADRSSVRLRRVSDPLLMIVRAAVIACAALAVARPLFLTDARIARWSDRIARVVIVDAGVDVARNSPEAAIAAEAASADPFAAVRTTDLRAALRRAAGWLNAGPPVRREIVVHSDFRRGAIDEHAIAQVSESIGLRLVPMKGAALAQTPGVAVLAPGAILNGDVRLEGERTSVAYATQPFSADGLQIIAEDPRSVASLVRIVQSAGAFAPSPAQPILIRFSKQAAAGVPDAQVPRGPADGSDWTLGAATRFLDGSPAGSTSVTAKDGVLVIDSDADADSLAAAQLLKSALDARPDPRSFERLETERVPDETLAGWSRPPAPPDAGQWRQTDESDGRWLWVVALVLLAVETVLRRSKPRAAGEVIADAA